MVLTALINKTIEEFDLLIKDEPTKVNYRQWGAIAYNLKRDIENEFIQDLVYGGDIPTEASLNNAQQNPFIQAEPEDKGLLDFLNLDFENMTDEQRLAFTVLIDDLLQLGCINPEDIMAAIGSDDENKEE